MPKIRGSDVENVIPDYVILGGTFRCFSDALYEEFITDFK